MKHIHNTTMRSIVLLASVAAATPVFALPEAPVGINAEVCGTRVDLSWSNGDAGATLLECGFEDGVFPPEGWSQKVTNDYEYLCSWFHYPSDDFKKQNNWTDYMHSGERSAMLYFDMFGFKGDHDPAQDEWLTTPAVDGAAYLDLYYFIDPIILEYGADEAFPDHYYVKASYDKGETWEILWDARNDARPALGWHQLVLPLKGGESAMVAFQGVSDAGEMVHLLWALDDVKMLSSKSGTDIIEGYTIMLDGQKVAEHVKSLDYSDTTPKSAGTHRYEIFAESGDALSPAGEIEVTIADIKLLPPANVKVDYAYDDMAESYVVNIGWEAPQGGAIDPIYYNVYCDGMEIATMLEEMEIEFYGYSKGVYDFKVAAVYENPDGESDRIGERIALGTRFNAHNLRASVTETGIALEWDAPEEEDCEVSHYDVWRADRQVADGLKELSFLDNDVPAGKYRYYVETFYADGENTIPVYIDVDNGESMARSLPFAENFNSGHMPADWFVENMWDATPDNLLWQFDDPNGLGVAGEGFDNGFASIDCINSGFYSLSGALTTPPVDISNCDRDGLSVSFAYDYASDGFSSIAILEVELDGDGNWIPVFNLVPYEPAENGDFMPAKESVRLRDFAEGASTMRLRWNYNGMFDHHLAIDNVLLSDGQSGVEDTVTGNISVHSTADGITVSATEGISAVEIHGVDGRLLKSVNAAGALRTDIAVENRNLLIVTVSTASATRTFKLVR